MATQGPLLPEVQRVLSECFAAESTSQEDKDACVEMLAQLSSFTEEDLEHGRAVVKDAKSLLKYMNKKLQQKGAAAPTGSAIAAAGVVEALQQQVQQQQTAVQQLQQQQTALQLWKEQVAGSIGWMTAILKDLFDYSESGITASSVPAFKSQLLGQYSKQRSNKAGWPLAYCMLSHVYLPTQCVIAAHLWKRLWAKLLYIMGFEDINDPRNGLLLWKPIEWAFDSSRLIFVYDPAYNHFVAYLLDPAITSVKLLDKLLELQPGWNDEDLDSMRRVMQSAGGPTTFGDLEGRWLRSDGLQDPTPFTRVLAFQAQRALIKAREKGWNWEHVPEINAGTPGPWQENVTAWFRSLEGHDAADLAAALAQD